MSADPLSSLASSTSVTLDTNILSGVVDPDRWLDEPEHTAYCAIHEAVKCGRIRAFFSEAIVAIDAIARTDKVAIIGATRLVSQVTSTGPNQIAISIGSKWKQPIINEKFLARIRSAQNLGLRALIGPRRLGDSVIAQGFGDGFYEDLPSGAAFQVATDRMNKVDAAIVGRGLGRCRAINLGLSFSKRDGANEEWWIQGLQRAKGKKEQKLARLAINEWVDGEAVAAHAGYGNHFFCTADEGGDLREGSVLHPLNRIWLNKTYSIEFVSINELVKRI